MPSVDEGQTRRMQAAMPAAAKIPKDGRAERLYEKSKIKIALQGFSQEMHDGLEKDLQKKGDANNRGGEEVWRDGDSPVAQGRSLTEEDRIRAKGRRIRKAKFGVG